MVLTSSSPGRDRLCHGKSIDRFLRFGQSIHRVELETKDLRWSVSIDFEMLTLQSKVYKYMEKI